ncbi:MAG: NAD(P)H-hydrate dehydratase, partial [Eubacteriales bacterium]
TLVLKGTVTLVANRQCGITLVEAGSPGMAKGGSGDVLTGVIASLCAQGHKVYQAAVLGVLVNGIAGSLAAQETGEYAMTASDTIGMIGKAMDSLQSGKMAKQQTMPDTGRDALCRQPYRETYQAPIKKPYIEPITETKAEETSGRSAVRFADEPITLGSEGLEEHFNFLATDEDFPARSSRRDDDNPFGDRMDTRMRQGMPDHRRLIPKPFKR